MRISGIALLVSQSDGKATLRVAGRPMFELNPAAAVIWEGLAVGLPTQDIASQLAARFDMPEERVAQDVANFIELLKHHLLVFDDPQDGLLAGGFLEDARELARSERRGDRVGAGLERRLAARVVQQVREREGGADESGVLQTLPDRARRLAS